MGSKINVLCCYVNGTGVSIHLWCHYNQVHVLNYTLLIIITRKLKFSVKHNRSSKVAVRAPVFMAHPSYSYSKFSVTLHGNGFQRLTFLCWQQSHTNLLLFSHRRTAFYGNWYSLYILNTDRTENTFQHLLHCCVLHGLHLAMAVSVAPQFFL
jgi:hypothetical protein